jgi:hypothetical protein
VLQPYDRPEKLQVGAEYGSNDAFIVRTGYIFNADELGLNAGVGEQIECKGSTCGLITGTRSSSFSITLSGLGLS